MTEVRDRVSGLASLEDTAADKQRKLDQICWINIARSNRTYTIFGRCVTSGGNNCLAAEEAVAKQETAIVDLAERASCGQNWLPRLLQSAENGGAEFVMDSDLKQAEFEGRPRPMYFYSLRSMKLILREIRGEWRPKPKLLRLLRKI